MGKVKRNGNNKICLTSGKVQMATESTPLVDLGYSGIFTGVDVTWILNWTGGTSPYSVIHDGILTPVVTSDLYYTCLTGWLVEFGDYYANYTVTDDVGQFITGTIYVQVV